jgi:hypothetical protein
MALIASSQSACSARKIDAPPQPLAVNRGDVVLWPVRERMRIITKRHNRRFANLALILHCWRAAGAD